MMQITYYSPDGKTFEFHTYPWSISNVEGLYTPSTSSVTQTSPFQDGSTYVGTTLQDREVPITVGYVGAFDETSIQTARRNLQNVCNPKTNDRLGNGRIIVVEGSVTRQFYGRVDSVSMQKISRRDPGCPVIVTFVCSDPYAYSLTNSYSNASAVTPMSFGNGVTTFRPLALYNPKDSSGNRYVTNYDFSSGATGWNTDTRQRISQQGWVCKLSPTNDRLNIGFDSASGGQYYGNFPAVAGDVITLIFTGRLTPATTATAVNAVARYSTGVYNSGSYPANGSTSVAITKASDGTGWVTKAISATAPSGTQSVSFYLGDTGTFTGDVLAGYFHVLKNGVPIATNPDFSDGSAGWMGIVDEVFVYDTASAYMGNSYDGTSRNTCFITPLATGDIYLPNQIKKFNAIYGASFKLSVCVKNITPISAGAGPIDCYITWHNENGIQIATSSFSITPNDSWQTVSQDMKVPENPLIFYGHFQGLQNPSDGIWAFGYVDVMRLDYSYLGTSNPEGVTVTVDGDASTEPEITITGACVNPRVSIGDDYVQYNGTLEQYDTLVIDCANATVKLNGNTAIQNLDIGSTFISLQPGDNTVICSVSGVPGNSNFVLKYASKFVGI